MSNTNEDRELIASVFSGKTSPSFTRPITFKDPEVVADLLTFSPSFKTYLKKYLTTEELGALAHTPENFYNDNGLYSKHLVLDMLHLFKKQATDFDRKWRKYKEHFPPSGRGKDAYILSPPTQLLLNTLNTSYQKTLEISQKNISQPMKAEYSSGSELLQASGLKVFFSTPNRVDIFTSTTFSLALLQDLFATYDLYWFLQSEPTIPPLKIFYYGLSYPLGREFGKNERVKMVLKQIQNLKTTPITAYPEPHSTSKTGIESYIQHFINIKGSALERQYKQQQIAELYDRWDNLG